MECESSSWRQVLSQMEKSEALYVYYTLLYKNINNIRLYQLQEMF